MPKIDYAAELNAEQLAAVTAPDGPLLVLAAAGTGKTRTLVYRVAYLVERGVDPRHILLLTFTNRAAREMMERAAVVAGPGVGGVWGGTFHHMANRVLRPYAERLGYGSDYAIIDRDDSKSLVANCIKALKLLRTMEQLGVNLRQTEEDKKPDVNTQGQLYGKSILFTGSLSQMTREEAEKLATAAGASIASGVS